MNWQPPDEIHVPRRVPRGAVFLILVASVLAGFAAVERNCLFFAAPLYLLAILVWVVAPKAFTLRFDPDGIVHRQSGIRVLYAEITCLLLTRRVIFDAKGAAQASEMIIGHPRGCLRLPKHAPVSRLELYLFLRDQSRLLEPPVNFPGRLREVYEREVADFGSGQVLASAGRDVAPSEIPETRMLFAVSLVFIAAAIAAAAGSASEGIAVTFGVIVGFTLFLGVILSAALSGQRTALRKLRGACGIVISPRGLTMETPALKGALGWAELKGVTEMNRGNALVSGLLLKIEGGQILLGDHFTCPLTEIRRRIEANLAYERR
jgi:hypothetical protein